MISIALTGDIAFSGCFKDSWKEDFIDTRISQFLNKTDYVVANIESPITNQKIDSKRALNHVSSPKAISRLMELNANVWNLSNNHILDCGKKGVLDTLRFAKEYGCKTVGVGKNLSEASRPLVLGEKEKIGIISILNPWRHIQESQMALTWDEQEIIKKRISELRKEVRWIIAVVHGGEEFSNMPLSWIRRKYLKFIDWGVDVVAAHHPHVVQNYEVVRDKIIFYSLGNFIFDTNNQRNFKYTDKGILLKLHFFENEMKWEYITTQIDREEQKVIVGEKPAIFCDISSWNYKLLWPAAAKQFAKNDDYKKRSLSPIYRKMSDVEWKFHKIKSYRHKQNLIVLAGCILNSFKMGYFSKLRDVYNYISEK